MNKASKQVVFGLIAVAMMSTLAFGQPSPDPSLWNNVQNPSGLQAVPVVYYDQATGVMSLNNLGLNGVSDTAGGSAIGGDDVGTISLLIRGPEPTSNFPPFQNATFDPTNGIAWSYQYFNGRAQLIGNAVTGQYILPGVNQIFQYAAGLTAADFQDVEMAVNFTTGAPGANLFGSVQIVVPEPAVLALIGSLLLGICSFRRRG